VGIMFSQEVGYLVWFWLSRLAAHKLPRCQIFAYGFMKNIALLNHDQKMVGHVRYPWIDPRKTISALWRQCVLWRQSPI